MRVRPWAFVIPLVGFGMVVRELVYLAGEVGGDLAAAIGFAAGVALGALWFLLHPRDLADRLFVVSSCSASGSSWAWAWAWS